MSVYIMKRGLSQSGKKYIWNRYSIAYNEVTGNSTTVSRTYNYSKYASTSYSIQSDGFTLTNPTSTTFENLTSGKQTVDISNSTNNVSTGATLYKITSNSGRKWTYSSTGESGVWDGNSYISGSSTFSFNENTGVFSLGTIHQWMPGYWRGYEEGFTSETDDTSTTNTVYTINSSSSKQVLIKTQYDGSYQYSQTSFTASQSNSVSITYTPFTIEVSRGEFIDSVSDREITTYPENGIQDGYWYVRKVMPSEVQFVEYIESTGTQYIDTGYKPNNNTRLVGEFEVLANGSEYRTIFGGRDANLARCFALYVSPNNNFYGNIGGAQDYYHYSSSLSILGRHTVDANKNVMSIDDMSYTFPVRTFQNETPICLFANNNANTVIDMPCAMRWYPLKIYDGDNLVRDYSPCLDNNGVACMYEAVNGAYVYNAGTGSFIAG